MLSDFFDGFVRLVDAETLDGFGGVTRVSTDGDGFLAGISTNNSTQMQIAEQQGLKTVYTIVAETSVPLECGSRVKRVSDGKVFVLTSSGADMETPGIAQVRFHQATAEAVSV